jgi:hypothetical protein
VTARTDGPGQGTGGVRVGAVDVHGIGEVPATEVADAVEDDARAAVSSS